MIMPKYIKEGDVIVALMDAPWWDDNDEDVAYDALDSVRAADVAEVRHGYWKRGVPYTCSVCDNPAPEEKNTDKVYSCWLAPYCPHCGARMDGKGDTE